MQTDLPRPMVAAIADQTAPVLQARIAVLEAENARLAMLLRVRDDFLTQAAHELRNPMTPILGQVQLLRRQVEIGISPPEAIKGGLARLEWVISRYIRRATVLLDVTRLQAGRLRLHPMRTPLGPLTLQLVEELRAHGLRTGTTITVDMPEAITGTWDRLAVEQMLDNLLSNAIKYGGGSAIILSARMVGDDVHIAVSDGGPGIAYADQALIFERFERGSKTNRHTGFGVGLWIVREIAAAMGGSVTVRSALSEGATFTVMLPLHSPRFNPD